LTASSTKLTPNALACLTNMGRLHCAHNFETECDLPHISDWQKLVMWVLHNSEADGFCPRREVFQCAIRSRSSRGDPFELPGFAGNTQFLFSIKCVPRHTWRGNVWFPRKG
jgi:hypothetical protein